MGTETQLGATVNEDDSALDGSYGSADAKVMAVMETGGGNGFV